MDLPHNTITAQEAYDQASIQLDEVDVSADLEALYTAIKESVSSKAAFAIRCGPYPYPKSIKMLVILEKQGYKVDCNFTGNVVEGIPQMTLEVNWMHFSLTVRERTPKSRVINL